MRKLFPLLAFAAALSLAPAFAAEGDPPPPNEAQAELTAEQAAQLIAQLDSAEPAPRAQAAEALGKAKVLAALPKLIAMLDDPDDNAQWQATVAIGAIGVPSLPRLVECLGHEKERVRWKAETAIKMIGAEAVPALTEALKDKRARVRQSAAFLLGQLKDPRAVDALAEALNDKDEDTRWKAADSLAKIGGGATRAVVRQLASESIEARRCAAWVFQQTGDAEAIPALVRALKDADDQVRWKAAIALQKFGAQAAAPLLTILRSQASDDEKKMAIWVLEGVKDVQVQTALRDLQGALSRGGQEKTEQPRPKVLPKSVDLAVTSEPDKATVFVDDKYVGVTPLTVKALGPGHHFIKLTKRDHLPWTKLVELLYPEEKLNAKLAVKPKGVLIVTSDPPAADVYIDGEYEGKTPLEKKNLDANPYSVRVEKEHFLTWEAEAEIQAGKEAKLHAPLKSKVEGWYLARLKEDPNDVSCHTELAHYYMVRGQLDTAAKSLASAVEVMGRSADTSGYAGRLLQEFDKIWSQTYQFGGNLQLPEVRKAIHAAVHEVWQKNQKQEALRQFLARVENAIKEDFTQPAK